MPRHRQRPAGGVGLTRRTCRRSAARGRRRSTHRALARGCSTLGCGDAAVGTGRVLRLGAVSGANRFKFFRTPAVTTLRTVPPDVLLSVEPVHVAAAPAKVPEPLAKTVGTQSDYRESEAQTDPFTPDYIAPNDGSQPELLQLKVKHFEIGVDSEPRSHT